MPIHSLIVALVISVMATTAGASARFGIDNGLPDNPPPTVVAQAIMQAADGTTTVIYSYSDGFAQGRQAANSHPTGGAFAGGFA
jgi:hypothetical protein